MKKYNYSTKKVRVLKEEQERYGWTDEEVQGLLDGSVVRLDSVNQGTQPILYSQASMKQLIENDSERCNTKKEVKLSYKE